MAIATKANDANECPSARHEAKVLTSPGRRAWLSGPPAAGLERHSSAVEHLKHRPSDQID